MKLLHTILIGASLLVVSAPSSSFSTTDFDVLAEACNSLKAQEKRKQCQTSLEKAKGESKPSDFKSTSKPQITSTPINFKEISLGRSGVKENLTELCKLHKSNQQSSYDKKDRCEFLDKRNIIWLSYGNLGSVLAVIDVGEGDTLDSIEITAGKSAMLELAAILQEKYGAPKRTTNSVENKMGTKFEQEIFVWVDAQGN